jgi:GT2 family glycosyltransferase
LASCLDSILRHAPPGSEVLVVDDGAVDGAAARTAESFPGVRALRLESNGGFCRAVNAGVAATSGEIVEVLNDDTEVTSGWADAALARFSDPTIAAVTPLVLLGAPGEEAPMLVDSTGDCYHVAGIARKRGHGERLWAGHFQPGPVFGASGSSSFFRRSVLEQVGGFPEEFVAYFDDVDLSFRLHRAGYRVFYEPASRVYHRLSSSYGRPRGELLALQSRNEELVFWRNLPAGLLLRALPSHLAVVAAKALARAREGQLGPFLRGRWAALMQLGAVLHHRRKLARLNPVTADSSWRLERGLRITRRAAASFWLPGLATPPWAQHRPQPLRQEGS